LPSRCSAAGQLEWSQRISTAWNDKGFLGAFMTRTSMAFPEARGYDLAHLGYKCCDGCGVGNCLTAAKPCRAVPDDYSHSIQWPLNFSRRSFWYCCSIS
jgi:hypothetical protein